MAAYTTLEQDGPGRLTPDPARYVQEKRRKQAEKRGITIEQHNRNIAGAKLLGGLSRQSRTVGVEANSVYGTALLIPQLARTLQWPREVTLMAARSYLYLLLCVFLHMTILIYISKEERVMDAFSGQMYLCDFGAMDGKGDQGIGPGGTQITPPRLYGWGQWTTRNYVRDSLLSIFPDKADDITKAIDPELTLCYGMAALLYYLPPKNEDWIQLEDGDHEDKMDDWLNHVTVKACGISYAWKTFYTVTVLLPKISLFYATVRTGVIFLMETAGIDDIIVNSVALGFLLGLDEMICSSLMSGSTNQLIGMCNDYEIPLEAGPTNDEVHLVDNLLFKKNASCFQNVLSTIPMKLVLSVGVTMLFVFQYYDSNCRQKNGRFVSRTMYLPTTVDFHPLNAMFPMLFPLTEEEEPYWQYKD